MEPLVRGNDWPVVFSCNGQMERVERSQVGGSFLQPCSRLPVVAVFEVGTLEYIQPEIVCKCSSGKRRMFIDQLLHAHPPRDGRCQFDLGQQTDHRPILLLERFGRLRQGFGPIERRNHAGVEIGKLISHARRAVRESDLPNWFWPPGAGRGAPGARLRALFAPSLATPGA